MSRNYYISGEWNLICDVCGKKIKAHKARHRWDGLVVCEKDYETRQPQDFVKARVDKITVPFLRPRPTDTFTFTCTLYTSQGRADMGVADCARADIVYPNIDWCTIQGSTGIVGIAVVGCSRAGKNF